MRGVTSTGLLSSAVFLLVTLVSDRQWLGSVGVGGRNTRPAKRKCQSAWNATHPEARYVLSNPVFTGAGGQVEDGWGRRVWLFRGLETHWQNLLLWGSSTQGLVLSCSLLVNLRIGVSGWATGDSDPSSAGSSSGVLDWGCSQKSVTSCEWLFQIILISFLLSFHHTVWLESVLILFVSSHHLEPGVSVVFLAVHRNPASCVLTLLQALWDSRAADPSPVPCCMMVTSWSVMASLPRWFSVFEVCAHVLYRIKHLGLLALSSFFHPGSDLNKKCRQEHLKGFVGWFLKLPPAIRMKPVFTTKVTSTNLWVFVQTV